MKMKMKIDEGKSRRENIRSLFDHLLQCCNYHNKRDQIFDIAV